MVGKCEGFFGEHAPSTLTQLDNEAIWLKRLLEHVEETVVCMLGQAAVGKSTLLNAVVAGSSILLPAGGIGPSLTAIATRVCYSEEPYFRRPPTGGQEAVAGCSPCLGSRTAETGA